MIKLLSPTPLLALLALSGCSEPPHPIYDPYDRDAATVVSKMLSSDRDVRAAGYGTAIHATAPGGNPARVDSIVEGILRVLDSTDRAGGLVSFVATAIGRDRPDLAPDLLQAVRVAQPSVQYTYARIAHRLPRTPELLQWLTTTATAAPGPVSRAEVSWEAVSALSRMGGKGRAVLRELDRDSTVTDPLAAMLLADLRKNGFRAR